MAGLKLLCSLLSHEENPGNLKTKMVLFLEKLTTFLFLIKINFNILKFLEAEDYLHLFSQINTREISALNLGYHITEKPAKNCANLALKILNIYNNSNPEINSFLISQIVNQIKNILK